MAFGSPARVFIVCFAAMVAAAAAAMDPNMPGMDMPPAPAPSATTMVSPSAVVGVIESLLALDGPGLETGSVGTERPRSGLLTSSPIPFHASPHNTDYRRRRLRLRAENEAIL
ncbi:hypothetical protein L1987_16803 [Smallanthus sonchifolius]|uniref:Uncharacterized protein n=1 Tax=Smallanthus sonchifolius TaxID=185202 RepID=A0ACB9IVN3_9ASTR|nr:hypothetical protein L1987_16803 [Smallanthus sonchifolius]